MSKCVLRKKTLRNGEPTPEKSFICRDNYKEDFAESFKGRLRSIYDSKECNAMSIY